eukprot:1031477-Amphidinium_carterae.3
MEAWRRMLPSEKGVEDLPNAADGWHFHSEGASLEPEQVVPLESDGDVSDLEYKDWLRLWLLSCGDVEANLGPRPRIDLLTNDVTQKAEVRGLAWQSELNPLLANELPKPDAALLEGSSSLARGTATGVQSASPRNTSSCFGSLGLHTQRRGLCAAGGAWASLLAQTGETKTGTLQGRALVSQGSISLGLRHGGDHSSQANVASRPAGP